jgi:hypothetical protein
VEVTDLALLESLAQPVPIMDDPGY